MLVKVIPYAASDRIAKTLNLSPFEIPRKGDTVAFAASTAGLYQRSSYNIRDVVWEYNDSGELVEVRLMVL